MTQYNPFEGFEQAFRTALDGLTSQSEGGEALRALEYVENRVDGADLGDYVLPEWLSPYASIAGQVMLGEMGFVTDDPDDESLGRFMMAFVPAVAHAVRLGYVDGYLRGYEEGAEEAQGTEQ